MVNREELHGPPPQPASHSSVIQEPGWKDGPERIEPSPGLRADLLDLAAWAPVLEAYARTVKVAVALTDCDGKVLGPCHNPQPVWEFVHSAAKTRRTTAISASRQARPVLPPGAPWRAEAW